MNFALRPDNSPSILEHLVALYGDSTGSDTFVRLQAHLERFRASLQSEQKPPTSPPPLTQRDAMLITYGDQLQEPGKPPLRTLADFCEHTLLDSVSGIHLLPFFPYSSDDGFSVIDYRQVNPALGDWEDVRRLGNNFRLMFDAVVNHVSAQSAWFQGFLQGDPEYQDYFIVVDGDPDLSRVVRPRALPLLTNFDTALGPRQVWTTFSADQVDLNYHDPQVLLEIIDVILFYVAHGAQVIRLDAIAYLWKEIGTPCIHLPQTHSIVQLLRGVLDLVAPSVLLITETNVPHAENISYFGDGYNEAQLVYNFALPPLVLHTFQTGSAKALSRWAAGLELPSERTTFFNFLASHDGIGINPARGILPETEIDTLIEQALAYGGLISEKQNSDGSHSPYELNINYFDALSNAEAGEPLSITVSRFICSQAIMLSLLGVPGIYFHSLFGSHGWREGVDTSGLNRSINRQKLELATLLRELSDVGSQRSQVFIRYTHLLQSRAASPAFNPYGRQQILPSSEHVFAVLRLSPDGEDWALCLHNVTQRSQTFSLTTHEIPVRIMPRLRDIITSESFRIEMGGTIRLGPHQVLWLLPDENQVEDDENP